MINLPANIVSDGDFTWNQSSIIGVSVLAFIVFLIFIRVLGWRKKAKMAKRVVATGKKIPALVVSKDPHLYYGRGRLTSVHVKVTFLDSRQREVMLKATIPLGSPNMPYALTTLEDMTPIFGIVPQPTHPVPLLSYDDEGYIILDTPVAATVFASDNNEYIVNFPDLTSENLINKNN